MKVFYDELQDVCCGFYSSLHFTLLLLYGNLQDVISARIFTKLCKAMFISISVNKNLEEYFAI